MKSSIDFFIFSPPRSGSTLLCALISSGTDIIALNDTFIFRQYSEHMRHYQKPQYKKLVSRLEKGMKRSVKKLSPKLFKKARLYKEMTSTKKSYIPDTKHLPNTGYSPPKKEVVSYVESLVERLERPIYIVGQRKKSWKKIYTRNLTPKKVWGRYNNSEKSLKSLMDIVFDVMIPKKYENRKIRGEKTPFHLYYSKWIREVYEEPKKIILIRHPIANIASILKRSSSKLRDAINQYMSYFDERYEDMYNSKNTLLVKYERIIDEPKNELHRIYSFLGSSINKKDVNLNFNYEFGHGYVGDGIDKSRDSSLRDRLSRKQKEEIKNRCSKVIDKFY